MVSSKVLSARPLPTKNAVVGSEKPPFEPLSLFLDLWRFLNLWRALDQLYFFVRALPLCGEARGVVRHAFPSFSLGSCLFGNGAPPQFPRRGKWKNPSSSITAAQAAISEEVRL